MQDLDSITDLEKSGLLEKAYAALLERWREGARDRDTALRLMFLAWSACAEKIPGPEGANLECDEKKGILFEEILDEMRFLESDDPEALLAILLMLGLHWWDLPLPRDWRAVATECWRRASELRPEGFPAGHFDTSTTFGWFMDLHSSSGETMASHYCLLESWIG